MASDRGGDCRGEGSRDVHHGRVDSRRRRMHDSPAMVPPWLPRALEFDSLDARLVAALSRWLCASWHSIVGPSRVRALARVRDARAAADSLIAIPPKPTALLAAIVLQPRAAHHADVLAVLLLADDHMLAQRRIDVEDMEGKADVARARAAFRILLNHSSTLFAGVPPVYSVELGHDRSESNHKSVGPEELHGAWATSDNVISAINWPHDEPAAIPSLDAACVEEPESVAELRCRIAVLEGELAAAHANIIENQRRIRDLDKMFDFWTRLVLSEMKSSAATEAAARAAMCESINRLAGTPKLSPSNVSASEQPPLPHPPAIDPLSSAAFCAALGAQTPVALDRRTSAEGPPKRVFRNGHWVDPPGDDTHRGQHTTVGSHARSQGGNLGSRSFSIGRSSNSSVVDDAPHDVPILWERKRSVSSDYIVARAHRTGTEQTRGNDGITQEQVGPNNKRDGTSFDSKHDSDGKEKPP